MGCQAPPCARTCKAAAHYPYDALSKSHTTFHESKCNWQHDQRVRKGHVALQQTCIRTLSRVLPASYTCSRLMPSQLNNPNRQVLQPPTATTRAHLPEPHVATLGANPSH